jgi:predicted DNA-binding transcriptional regulator YafY
MMFSEEELEAMVLGTRWVAGHADPELAAAARAAMGRILGILPDSLRLQVETAGLFAPDWCPTAPEPWLPTLRRAIRDQRALHLAYADAGNRLSQRTIWPFAMAFLDDRRLLAAWCELRGEFRHFRADRVLGLEDAGRCYPQTRHALLKRWREHERTRQRA